jgi:signal transduction histidine kinase
MNYVITNVINNISSSASQEIFSKEINATAVTPIRLEYSHPQDILVQTDKRRIIQVINTLLINAIKFTQKGTMSINLEKKKEQDGNGDKYHIVISVKDMDQGIDPEILSKSLHKVCNKITNGRNWSWIIHIKKYY